jgi:hypothetical protein
MNNLVDANGDGNNIQGSDNQIMSSVNSSVFGYGNSLLSSNGSSVVGYQNILDTNQTSNNTVIGSLNNIQKGNNQNVIGQSNVIRTADDSNTVIGGNNTLDVNSNTNNLVIGYGNANNASNDNAIVGHKNTVNGGKLMYVLGFGNTTQQDENVVVGIGNEATVGSAYIFGQGITNTKNGTVDIGYGDSGKITVDGQGTLTLRGALDVSNGVGSAGQILMSQGGGLSPVWSDQSSLFANLPANNGLTNSSGTLQLGGSLVQNTSVNQMGYTFGFTGGNVGIGTSTPKNTLEVTSAVAGTSGLRLTNLTSATSSSTSSNKVLTVDANGDLVLAIVPGTQNIVDFSVNANPNTAGTTFSPNLPQNADVIYTSTIDNSMGAAT